MKFYLLILFPVLLLTSMCAFSQDDSEIKISTEVPSYSLGRFKSRLKSDNIINRHLKDGKIVIWRLHHRGKIVYTGYLSDPPREKTIGAVIADLEVSGNINQDGTVSGFGSWDRTGSVWKKDFECGGELPVEELSGDVERVVEKLTPVDAGLMVKGISQKPIEIKAPKVNIPFQREKLTALDSGLTINGIQQKPAEIKAGLIKPVREKMKVLTLKINFTRCTNEFVDRDYAKSELNKVVDFLKEHPDTKVTIVGSIDDEGLKNMGKLQGESLWNDSSNPCSREIRTVRDLMNHRNKKIARFLNSRGIDEKRLSMALGDNSEKKVDLYLE